MTIMSVLLRNRLMSGSFCGGRGDCGRCVIQFLEGAPLPTGLERARLSPEELRQGYRLACVARPKRDCRVRITGGGEKETPIVTDVNLPSENIDLSSRKNRLSENQKLTVMESESDSESAFEISRKKPAVISKTKSGVIDSYIIAVDLGTTTIAMQLRDGETGAVADTYCEKNPQSVYGTDVLARIEASCKGNGAELQKLVCESLLRGLRQFAAYLRQKQDTALAMGQKKRIFGKGEKERQIRCMCIAGNTAMQHLLLGYDVEGLGKAPFVPVEKGLQQRSLSGLFQEEPSAGGQGADGQFSYRKILAGWEFPVYIAPCISAFVGGDIVAGLYALGMPPVSLRQTAERDGETETEIEIEAETETGAEPGQVLLLIDLGTNGEMAITDGQRMIVTATAAGPAFEGRGDLIGTDRIAVTADLLRRGILDETGLMAEPYFEEGVRIEAGEKIEITEKSGEKTGTTEKPVGGDGNKEKKNGCYFKKEDVRALQMAKAAVRAGVEILWEEMGRPEIGRIYLAGGFGYYLDVEAAITIGLLPAHMRGRVQAVGNTSLAGAYELGRALSQDETLGETLEKKFSAIESINLAKKERFEALYLQYMNLEEN